MRKLLAVILIVYIVIENNKEEPRDEDLVHPQIEVEEDPRIAADTSQIGPMILEFPEKEKKKTHFVTLDN